MRVEVELDIVYGAKTTILRVRSDFAVISRYQSTIKSTPGNVLEKSYAASNYFSKMLWKFCCFLKEEKLLHWGYTKLRNVPLPATPSKKTAQMGI